MRLHPLSAVAHALRRGVVTAGGVFFLSGALGVVLPDGSGDAVTLLVPLAFLLAAGYQVAYYYRFEYDLTADTLDIASGVVGRKEREIPYRRVQNVDLTESVFHRLFGVAVVRVETAGGSETEATLDFVSAGEARRLQREIRERRAAVRGERERTTEPEAESAGETSKAGEVTEATEPAVEPETGQTDAGPDRIFRLGEGELLVLSVASFRRTGVFLLAIGFPLVRDALLGVVARVTGVEVDLATLTQTPDLLFVTGLVAVVLGAAGSWAVSAALTFTEYYGFTLGRQGEDLVYDRGLLQRYSGSIPTDKVQTLTITENVLMRALGYAGLTVETAGYSPGQGGQDGSQAAVPLARHERTLALARDIEPFGDVSFTRPPRAARRRYAARYLLAVLAVTAVFAAVARIVGNFSLWVTPLALVPVVPVAAHYKWKHRGYHAGEAYFATRTGFWRRRTRIVPYYRLQTVVRARTVFQRRLGLAHLTADTATSSGAGGTATAYDIDAADARRLFGAARERLQASLGVRPGTAD